MYEEQVVRKGVDQKIVLFCNHQFCFECLKKFVENKIDLQETNIH